MNIIEVFFLSVLSIFCVLKSNSFVQLNGYKLDKNFCKYFKTKYFFFTLLAFFASLSFWVALNSVWMFVHVPLTIMLGVAYMCEKKKTPLIFTPRMKRMIFVELLILFGLGIAFPVSIFLLLPLIAALSKLICLPFEQTINKGFVDKAKRKLMLNPQVKVIGITGSFGKTSVKNILSTILSQKFSVTKTPSSFNTPLGIAKTINETDFTDVDYFICEMGAKHKGDIKELTDIVKPSFAIVTGVAPQHLETFKTIENIENTKFELIEGLSEHGFAVFNCDNLHCHNMAEKTSQKFAFAGLNSSAGCFAYDIEMSENGTKFNLNFEGRVLPCFTKILGWHNVLNISLAACLAFQIGLNDDEIQAGIKKLEFSPHRLELLKPANGFYILDDSYNANIVGVEESFVVLKCFKNKKFVIIAGIVEQGERQHEFNRKVGQMLAHACDFAILVGLNSKDIFDGLTDEKFDGNKIIFADSLNDGVDKLTGLIRAGDVILFSNDLPDNMI